MRVMCCSVVWFLAGRSALRCPVSCVSESEGKCKMQVHVHAFFCLLSNERMLDYMTL